MRAYSFNTFIIFLSFNLQSSHGFEVIQPQSQAVNPDGSASISCEHTANVASVEDVRLNAISINKRPLCQKGMKDCKNITMYRANPKKWLFIILNITPEAMSMKYQCQFTVKIDDLDYTKTGAPTSLLPGQKEKPCVHHTLPPPPPPPQSDKLRWILSGLLALTCLYSCIITSFYLRERSSDKDPNSSVYMEMRKAPVQKNTTLDIYCG